MPPRRGRPARACVEEQPAQPAAPANAMEQLAGALWAFIRRQPSPQHPGAAREGAKVGIQIEGHLAK